MLRQLRYISYVVLYCVYFYTVSHPITIMFSDERTIHFLCLERRVNTAFILSILPTLLVSFHL